MERKVQARRTVQGVVVSDKNDKTIVVLVETHKRHSKYGKRVKYGKSDTKFYPVKPLTSCQATPCA